MKGCGIHAAGHMITEANASGATLRAEIYAGDRHLATWTNNATYFNHADWLGTERARSFGSGPNAGQRCEKITSLPFGDGMVTQQENGGCGDPSPNHFTGKERDSESGLDYFGKRYDSSSLGRFTTPDPLNIFGLERQQFRKWVGNPQHWNMYAYVRNNPTTLTDPTGLYELNDSGCWDNLKCQKKWDRAATKFEDRREKDLNSKKADVRAAAAAYGAKGEVNGVHVGFANLASRGISGSVDPSGSTPGNPNVQVTLDFGRAGSAETQTHEGTHVADDLAFLNSYSTNTRTYDQNLSFTHGQTEFDAFRAGAEVNHEHGFGPNDNQKIWDYIRANYPARLLPMPVFDPNDFPTGPND
jgi:RHS repeat-associated protein